MKNQAYYFDYQSPIGQLMLVNDDSHQLTAIYFENHKNIPIAIQTSLKDANLSKVSLSPTIDALDQYFQTGRFEKMPAFIFHGTDFQKSVWQILCTINSGNTLSYGEIANMLGKPNAQRAVGAAVGLNPISILVPCHRVLGSQKKLTGFAGGIKKKEWLLEHEAIKKMETLACQQPI